MRVLLRLQWKFIIHDAECGNTDRALILPLKQQAKGGVVKDLTEYGVIASLS